MTKFRCKIGDRVAYSVAWLHSIGACTGDLPAMRGTVVGFKPLGDRLLAEVQWNGDAEVKRVLVDNLAHVGPNARFAKC